MRVETREQVEVSNDGRTVSLTLPTAQMIQLLWSANDGSAHLTKEQAGPMDEAKIVADIERKASR